MSDKENERPFGGVYVGPLELKFSGADQAGYFEGWGAVFGNIDDGGDLIEKGAFRGALAEYKQSGFYPAMRKMHGLTGLQKEPIGVWDSMEETEKGLYVKGRLVGLDTEQGKWNYAQLREGVFRGLSIGYHALPSGVRYGRGAKSGEPSRYLTKLNLREVSLVDNPMNAKAVIEAFKGLYMTGVVAAQDIKTKRQFEEFLRDHGFSAGAAKGIASKGFREDAGGISQDVLDAIQRNFTGLAQTIKG